MIQNTTFRLKQMRGIFSQLILNSKQWHAIALFSKDMILAKTRCKTHNQKLLARVEAFKTWRHYLEGCKLEVFVLRDHNNLC